MCTVPTLLCVAGKLNVCTNNDGWELQALARLDDFFHVPRHQPYVDISMQRVSIAHQVYQSTGALDPWVIEAHDYMCDHA